MVEELTHEQNNNVCAHGCTLPPESEAAKGVIALTLCFFGANREFPDFSLKKLMYIFRFIGLACQAFWQKPAIFLSQRRLLPLNYPSL
jgi:hypothetical protein